MIFIANILLSTQDVIVAVVALLALMLAMLLIGMSIKGRNMQAAAQPASQPQNAAGVSQSTALAQLPIDPKELVAVTAAALAAVGGDSSSYRVRICSVKRI